MSVYIGLKLYKSEITAPKWDYFLLFNYNANISNDQATDLIKNESRVSYCDTGHMFTSLVSCASDQKSKIMSQYGEGFRSDKLFLYFVQSGQITLWTHH